MCPGSVSRGKVVHFRDRSRSVTNLITQLTGVVVTERLCQSVLPPTADPDGNDKALDSDVELSVHLSE